MKEYICVPSVRNYIYEMYYKYEIYYQDELLCLSNTISGIVISLGIWSVMYHSMKSHGTIFFIPYDVKDVKVSYMVNPNICGIY